MLLTHSSRVKWAKLLFPLLAVFAIGIALFFDWSSDDKIVGEFTAEDKVFQDNSANVEKPLLDITTNAGDSYKLEASVVESMDGTLKRFSGGDVTGDLQINENHWEVSAEQSVADADGETISFQSKVTGVLDDQYTITSDELNANIRDQTVESPSRVQVESKLGQVSSDKMNISGEAGNRVIEFTGRVEGFFKVEKQQ